MYCGNAADSKTINGFVASTGGPLNTLTIRMFWSLQRGKLELELNYYQVKSILVRVNFGVLLCHNWFISIWGLQLASSSNGIIIVNGPESGRAFAVVGHCCTLLAGHANVLRPNHSISHLTTTSQQPAITVAKSLELWRNWHPLFVPSFNHAPRKVLW